MMTYAVLFRSNVGKLQPIGTHSLGVCPMRDEVVRCCVEFPDGRLVLEGVGARELPRANTPAITRPGVASLQRSRIHDHFLYVVAIQTNSERTSFESRESTDYQSAADLFSLPFGAFQKVHAQAVPSESPDWRGSRKSSKIPDPINHINLTYGCCFET